MSKPSKKQRRNDFLLDDAQLRAIAWADRLLTADHPDFDIESEGGEKLALLVARAYMLGVGDALDAEDGKALASIESSGKAVR